jgi:hypothetical protein
MFEKIKIFLNKIQNSNEAVKKRWLIGATAVSMILVVSFWLIYMQSTIQFSNNNIEKQESGVGFWQIFKNGLAIFSNSIKENIKMLFNEITQSRTITIE